MPSQVSFPSTPPFSPDNDGEEEYELSRVPERRNNELLAEFERRKKVPSSDPKHTCFVIL